MVPIVIPACDPESLAACTHAIRRNEPLMNPLLVTAVLDRMSQQGLPQPTTLLTGEQPFSFARNVNRGIRCWREFPAFRGAIILNQDAVLETPGGLSSLVAEADRHPDCGVMSASIRGDICNPIQQAGACDWGELIETANTVCFVAVYIPRRTLDAVGLLDERFVESYGRDDDLYCLRVRKAGLKLGVWHGCVVEHKSLPSAYRTNPDLNLAELVGRSLRIFAGIVVEEGLEPWLSADQRVAIGGLGIAV